MITSIVFALLGGALIGLAASAMLYLLGRVCGISGIVGGLLALVPSDTGWRAAFVGGLVAGGALLVVLQPGMVAAPSARSLLAVAIAGGLVGYGTRLGNGCTSGHGVCGLTRFSGRSVVATGAFMGTGMVTATLIGLFGGAL